MRLNFIFVLFFYILTLVSCIYILKDADLSLLNEQIRNRNVAVKPIFMSMKRVCKLLCKKHSGNIFLLMDHHCPRCEHNGFRLM